MVNKETLEKKITDMCVGLGTLTTTVKNVESKVDELKLDVKENNKSTDGRLDNLEGLKNKFVGGWIITVLIGGSVFYMGIKYAEILIEKKVESSVKQTLLNDYQLKIIEPYDEK